MELNNIYLGFALATFAGLSTGIGSGLAFLQNHLINVF